MHPNLQTVIQCIKEANDEGALYKNDILTGYSGEALYGTLQRIAKETLDENRCYLEVGVYQGLTLLSSASASDKSQFYGIDNFAFFDTEGRNKKIVEDRIEKLRLGNVELINKDYEDALEQLPNYIGNKKVGLYFVDGPHDYRSQLMCLMLIKPHLADGAIIVIDDSNYRHVRQANRDFLLAHPEFKLLYQSYTVSHPMNMDAPDKAKATQSWWNGVNILYKDTSNELDSVYPPTLRDRTIYENEHILHAVKNPEQTILFWKLMNTFKLLPILNMWRKPKKNFTGKYPSMNTYSEKLPVDDFNLPKRE